MNSTCEIANRKRFFFPKVDKHTSETADEKTRNTNRSRRLLTPIDPSSKFEKIKVEIGSSEIHPSVRQ
jgi:hypothetical protein